MLPEIKKDFPKWLFVDHNKSIWKQEWKTNQRKCCK